MYISLRTGLVFTLTLSRTLLGNGYFAFTEKVYKNGSLSGVNPDIDLNKVRSYKTILFLSFMYV